MQMKGDEARSSRAGRSDRLAPGWRLQHRYKVPWTRWWLELLGKDQRLRPPPGPGSKPLVKRSSCPSVCPGDVASGQPGARVVGRRLQLMGHRPQVSTGEHR